MKKKSKNLLLNFDNYPEVTDAIDNALPHLRANPRRIKRFINSFRLLALIANRKALLESGAITLALLAKWTVIQIRWPDIIDALETDSGFIERLKEAQELHKRISQEKNMAMASEAIRIDRRILNQYLADPRISRMIDEEEFTTLASEFKGSLSNYIHLAHVV